MSGSAMRWPQVIVRVVVLTLAVLCPAGLAACSGDDNGDGAKPTAGSSAGTGATPAVGASPSPGATAADLPVLGSRKTTDGSLPLQVDLNEVRVSGQVMTVTYTMRNLLPGSSPAGRWQIAEFLDDGLSEKLADGSSELGLTSDGVYVVDSAAAKRYLVARDTEGRCVCSSDLSNAFVGPGQGMVLTGVFGAPPASTTKVDVYVPHAGSFPGITISR